MVDDWQHGGFGLYVHWPFCEAKCPYCDFNSHVVRNVDHDAWRNALLEELDKVAALTPGRTLGSVFFGGGTPSLMKPSTVEAIIRSATDHWTPANDIEITLEANPSSVEAQTFVDLRMAGVNRVSLGVQALNDLDLKRLGRLHSVADARNAIDKALQVFSRASIDLIYARQDQSMADWETELKMALTLGLSHISLYQLTIEPNTAFGDRYRVGRLRGLPTDDESAELFELTQDLTGEAGLMRYEVSNHALPGEASRHNLIYWRYGDYAGIGPGAHGRLTIDQSKRATEQPRAPQTWLQSSNRTTISQLKASDRQTEMLLMGLRLAEGVDLNRWRNAGPLQINRNELQTVLDTDLVRIEKNQLRATDSGILLLNSILDALLPSD